MRGLLFILITLVTPSAFSETLGFDAARHLLNRAGFAASYSQVSEFSQITRAEAVDRLLSDSVTVAQSPAPAWTGAFESFRVARGSSSAEERAALARDLREKSIALRAWWFREMLATPSELSEKMTLFWHNHFVSAQQKVRSPQLMYRQNVLLRKHALGNFGELLHAIARDPAMVIYLDNASNRKERPNENFAREVMELFTLGEGHRYDEHDIKEVARAFTGWSIDRESGEFLFRPQVHDNGVKTVLGQSGNFDGDAVLDILLAQPQTAETITLKLWREFVSPEPDQAEIARIAALFRDSGYDIKTVLRALLTSDAFFGQANRATLIKSPVELVVGTIKQFEFAIDDDRLIVAASRNFGQDIFNPPNVKGWRGQEAWLNSTTLLARKQLLERLFRSQESIAMSRIGESSPAPGQVGGNTVRVDVRRWAAQFGTEGDARRNAIQRLVAAAEPLHDLSAARDDLAFLQGLVTDPVYQLK